MMITPATPSPLVSMPRPPLARAPWRVVIADESAENRAILRAPSLAFDHRVEVVEAADGAALVEALVAAEPDIAFVNVHLPDVTGAEALAFARTKGLRTTAILMASQIVPRWVEFCQELGAYEFLKNPLDPDHVAQLLRGVKRMRMPASALMVVENEVNRTLVRKVLQGSRFNLDLEETDTGRHALKLMRVNRYDVVFIDSALSDLDGLETACQARETAPEARLVLMIPEDAPHLVQSAHHFGVSGVLAKPFYARDVDITLHKVLGLRRPYLLNALLASGPAPAAGER